MLACCVGFMKKVSAADQSVKGGKKNFKKIKKILKKVLTFDEKISIIIR